MALPNIDQIEETKNEKAQLLKKHYDDVAKASSNLEFKKMGGDDLLSLPEGKKE